MANKEQQKKDRRSAAFAMLSVGASLVIGRPELLIGGPVLSLLDVAIRRLLPAQRQTADAAHHHPSRFDVSKSGILKKEQAAKKDNTPDLPAAV